MNKNAISTESLLGIYKLEGDDLLRDDGLHLKTGLRHRPKKGTAKRFIGEVKENSYNYISSLYPTRSRNVFACETGGVHYELEILSPDKVEIREPKKKSRTESALSFEGGE